MDHRGKKGTEELPQQRNGCSPQVNANGRITRRVFAPANPRQGKQNCNPTLPLLRMATQYMVA